MFISFFICRYNIKKCNHCKLQFFKKINKISYPEYFGFIIGLFLTIGFVLKDDDFKTK